MQPSFVWYDPSLGSTNVRTHYARTHHGIKVGFQVRIGGSLDFGPLDAFAQNALGEILAMTQKVFVVIPRGILTPGDAIKAIQIQLSLKRTEFAQFKVTR